jgi:hypothetical protein
MTDFNDIKAKIAKLANMTTENGASENEAMFAAKRIAELLDAHGMTISEMKDFQNENSVNKMETGSFGSKKKLHEVQYCVTAIAEFFDCKVWANRGTDSHKIKFFGFPQDVVAALALTEALVHAMESDYKLWFSNQNSEVHGKTLRKNFMLGFCSRINARLKEMKLARNVATTGTALIVVKGQVVTEEYAKLNMTVKKAYRSTYTSNNAAYEAGQSAGNTANLGNTKRIAA